MSTIYTHTIIIYTHELPAHLRAKLDARLQEQHPDHDLPPLEDRELRVTVESTESDPENVKQMLIERLT